MSWREWDIQTKFEERRVDHHGKKRTQCGTMPKYW